MDVMSLYLKSNNENDFISSVENQGINNVNKLFIDIENLLKECNEVFKKEPFKLISFPVSKSWHTQNYCIKNNYIKINYASEKLKNLLHPQLAYLTTLSNTSFEHEFHVFLEKDLIHLFHNKKHSGSFTKSNYHLLQGQFAMELLCVLTNTEELDWLGTFHASTISYNQEAIMLVGESGKGKSTLSALLMANGYNFVADDFTPIHAKTQTVYNFPNAISIKEGSFQILEPLIKNFSTSVTNTRNSSKGDFRYIKPFNINTEKSLSCSKMVIVNYKENAETTLKEVSIDYLLNILIPDSWLSPNSKNAAYFLNWLDKITVYELTYSDNKEVLIKFKELFNN